MTNDNLRTGTGNHVIGHILTIHDDVYAGIIECRHRLRRRRATKRRDASADPVSQLADGESHSSIAEIDRRAMSRAICEVTGEADET